MSVQSEVRPGKLAKFSGDTFFTKEDSDLSLNKSWFGCHHLGDHNGLSIPNWVARYLGDSPTIDVQMRSTPGKATSYKVRTITGNGSAITLISIIVTDVRTMSAERLQQSAHEVYALTLNALMESKQTAVRFWNFFPGINEVGPVIDGVAQDRYMFFNAGRSMALQEYFGSYRDLSRLVCTATGIGNDHAMAFTVHCLASSTASNISVENPRQVPAYLYSSKYGARAPSFARATITRHPNEETRRLFIVAGTASIIGEDTVHLDDPLQQTYETFRNLHVLLRTGCERLADETCLDTAGRDALAKKVLEWPRLGSYYSFRVYIKKAEHREVITNACQQHAPAVAQIEYLQATICRPTLLVEIECIAEIDVATCQPVFPIARN